MLLAAAVLFIIGNTVRLELHARREEVVIAKLVGATNSFIYRPFLYTGFWIGFLSGMSAWFIVTILMLILRQSVEVLSELYGGGFHLMFLSFSETLAMISLTSFLGVLGSWVVLICQLQNTRP
jgi:cell division transport system permease protein